MPVVEASQAYHSWREQSLPQHQSCLRRPQLSSPSSPVRFMLQQSLVDSPSFSIFGARPETPFYTWKLVQNYMTQGSAVHRHRSRMKTSQLRSLKSIVPTSASKLTSKLTQAQHHWYNWEASRIWAALCRMLLRPGKTYHPPASSLGSHSPTASAHLQHCSPEVLWKRTQGQKQLNNVSNLLAEQHLNARCQKNGTSTSHPGLKSFPHIFSHNWARSQAVCFPTEQEQWQSYQKSPIQNKRSEKW